MSADECFEGWAIVELMGHRKLGGYVKTTQIMGAPMLRIEVPPGRGQSNPTTQFYSPTSLYCLTPTTEEIARGAAMSFQPAPVSVWELPRTNAQLESRSPVRMSEPEMDFGDDEEYDKEGIDRESLS